jgi:trans-AT polyketide synthase/acyltransferase/oxidoreductase domain-containing protein
MVPSNSRDLSPVGLWRCGGARPAFGADDLSAVLPRVREPLHIVREGGRGRIGAALGGELVFSSAPHEGDYALMATLPPLYPEWMGDRSFCEVHGVRFPYVAGEMANGIATTRMVIAMGRAEMLAFFGAAGLAYERVEQAVVELERELGPNAPWGVNLIHSPNEPALENRIADLLIRHDVTRTSASAFIELTPAVVRCAAAGLRIDPSSGRVQRRRHVFAKVSRPEVAERFMSPPPEKMLRALAAEGLLTSAEAELAARLPVAEDITVEADSGGHTDNQALVALFPGMLALRDKLTERYGYERPIRVGAAGGLGTPAAVAAAFALGAAYVLTGSINQSAVESGLSETGKAMLAEADLSDVIMAPAADMFELGVRVQVLKRGTMFGVRAAKLYEVYRTFDSLEAIPEDLRSRLERDMLRATFEEIWAETQRFWRQRDPAQAERAETDSKHRMALVFRWYLGKASRWGIDGEASRRADYQIWCGPAMGSFNRWASGSFLAAPANRTVVQIARNLLEGAAVLTRAHQARTYGIAVPEAVFQFHPRLLS